MLKNGKFLLIDVHIYFLYIEGFEIIKFYHFNITFLLFHSLLLKCRLYIMILIHC